MVLLPKKGVGAGQAEPMDVSGCSKELGLEQGSVGPGRQGRQLPVELVLGDWRLGAPGRRLSRALLPPTSQDPFCEWHQSTSRKGDAACSRRGRGRGALKSLQECPPLCSQ